MKKILEEIEQRIAKAERIIVKPPHDELDRVANDTAEAFIEAYKECQELIRKHMDDDGWILCEERLPEEPKKGGDIKQYNVTIEGAEESTSLFYIGHGTWRDEDCNWYKVIAWQPLPAPYRPEKGVEI